MIFNLEIDNNLSIKVTNTGNNLKVISMTLKLNTYYNNNNKTFTYTL
jgi:hypothetical protein